MKKCNHLVGILKRHGEWENVTEKEFMQFFYAFGAITKRYHILSKINKDIRETQNWRIVDDLGLEGLCENEGREVVVFRMKRFGFCPFCGENLDWQGLQERASGVSKLADSRVDENTVKSRFRKRKLADQEFKKKYRLENKQKAEKEARQQKVRIGHIYVVKLDKNYKIGKSISPNARFKEFTLLPYELETVIVEKVKGYDEREKELHEIFADKRVRGEWFELNEEDIDYIKSYLKAYKVTEKSND